ncbi:CsbD family protein [Caenimonas soli]|uniref:CsbD family protein n=1 Tax=Caenimonas soli TaxID=2735555 RepID=UPI001552BD76|nr:CsbD family protein [Caenimonas soli]NPC56338.1 CsbD family protein [Caenimonas soli]
MSQFGLFINQKDSMNGSQIKGAWRSALGRVQEHIGKTIGSADQKAKGLLKQGQGKLLTACGKVRDVLKNSKHS